MTKIDWAVHVAAFRASPESAAAYCTAAGIKIGTFRYHLYKQKAKHRRRPKRFEEFQVATDLVIARDQHGGLSLSGFDVSHLPQIVGAWSNALS
jgi:hypothetical protein